MPGIKYKDSYTKEHIEGDTRVVDESVIVHGTEGLTAKFYHKDNKEEIRIVVKYVDGKYIVKTKLNGKDDEKTLSKEDALKELGKYKEMKFAVDYLKKAKDLARMSRASKRGSKRGSKNGSKKASKKSSKRGSKKSSKKNSRK